MEHLLEQLGLSGPQATAYLFLLRDGACTPPWLATSLHLTRSNAYKILDRLTELELVERQEIDKKFTYEARDPSSLHTLVAVEKDRVAGLEKAVKASVSELQKQYQRSVKSQSVRVYEGDKAIQFIRTYKSTAKTIKKLFTDEASASEHGSISWYATKKELVIIKEGTDHLVVRIIL